MVSIARVWKQNAALRRLHDLQVKALKKVSDYKIKETNRFIKEFYPKHTYCKTCEKQMESRRIVQQTQRPVGSSSDTTRVESFHKCEYEGCTVSVNKPGQCRHHEHTDRREHNIYCSHYKHGTSHTLLSTRCDSYEDPEINESVESKETNTGESSNKNITAFLFSRHCRHGYDMKKTVEKTENSTEYARKKIRAKVVKNYLLQDVFKRLSSTRSIVVKDRLVNNVDSTGRIGAPDTVQTLSQCRYLRVPIKQTKNKEGDTLTNVDVQ